MNTTPEPSAPVTAQRRICPFGEDKDIPVVTIGTITSRHRGPASLSWMRPGSAAARRAGGWSRPVALAVAGRRADLACRSAVCGLLGWTVVPDEVTELRRDLGRQLAGRRKAAGLVQREFGALMEYSRTAVANAETGHARIGRSLWERADRVLGTGELFARGFDRIHAQASVAARAGGPDLRTVAARCYRRGL